MEHYVTLFDSGFLPQGLCLHASLMKHASPFHLWVLCMDEVVEQKLASLKLDHVSLMPLKEVETAALKEVKKSRTKGEYCWTLTPFAPQFVFDRETGVKRVTYLDADLFFFDAPKTLFDELDSSGKQVLITEHAYAPDYDQTKLAGRFCVQFMTFGNNSAGLKVLHWWQAKCLEWCFDRYEEERFGDQKYLDKWPSIFDSEVHILRRPEKTLAPWNVRMFGERIEGNLTPVFYHFQALRIISSAKVMLYTGYKIGPKGKKIYGEYLEVLSKVIEQLRQSSFEIKYFPLKKESWLFLRLIKRRLLGTVAFESITGTLPAGGKQ